MAPDGEVPHFRDDSGNIASTRAMVKPETTDLSGHFSIYRSVVIRGDEILQGILPEDATRDSLPWRALDRWGGTHFLHQKDGETHVTLVRPLGPRRRERWWLHIGLALLTLFTTTIAGATFAGRQPVTLRWLDLGLILLPVPVAFHPSQLWVGFAFSLPLLCILLGHELGHYLMARRRSMDVSPPYFIPAPSWLNFIGTFGAFIRLRSAVVNRVALMEVGAGGPIVSFLLSIPVTLLGLHWSRVLPAAATALPSSYFIDLVGQRVWVGDSILFHLLRSIAAPAEGVLLLHPVAFAGWIGLFITALNLVPLSQLDGGHILYALVGATQRYFGLAFLGGLLLLGLAWWGWWLWAVLIIVIGRGSIGHPAVFDPEPPVTGLRRAVGWACIVIFIITFVPLPLQA